MNNIPDSLIFVFILAILTLLIGYIFIIRAFNHTEKNLIQVWQMDDHLVELEYLEEWAGPGYYRYTLYRHSFWNIKTRLGSYISGKNKIRESVCHIHFQNKKSSHSEVKNYSFDRCLKRITCTE